jgi:EGF-like domain
MKCDFRMLHIFKGKHNRDKRNVPSTRENFCVAEKFFLITTLRFGAENFYVLSPIPFAPAPHPLPVFWQFFLSISLLSLKQGLRNNITDACERHDPCQHGGICISTDSGPLCECRNLEYEGTYCERGKQFEFFLDDWASNSRFCVLERTRSGRTTITSTRQEHWVGKLKLKRMRLEDEDCRLIYSYIIGKRFNVCTRSSPYLQSRHDGALDEDEAAGRLIQFSSIMSKQSSHWTLNLLSATLSNRYHDGKLHD